MSEVVSCCVCGSRQIVALFDTHDRLLDQPGHYRFVRCCNCGLVYVHPKPTWAERATHYTLLYPGYHRLETEPSSLQRRSMEYGLQRRLRAIPTFPMGGRLLDVGCSGGDFIYQVRKQPGWQVYGLERVPEMAQAAYDRYGLSILVGDSLQLGLASNSFDFVTLWTVLEHLAEPMQGLEECVRVLRPGGWLAVKAIVQESWGARLFGSCWLGYDAPRILYVFSRPILRDMLRRAGLTVLRMGCYDHDYYPFLWSWRNFCLAHVRSTKLREFLIWIVRSWPVRLSSFPLFAMQTFAGKNSYTTVIARRD